MIAVRDHLSEAERAIVDETFVDLRGEGIQA
jgi:hypothetical protein